MLLLFLMLMLMLMLLLLLLLLLVLVLLVLRENRRLLNLLATFLGVANATLKGLPANHAPFISINALCLSSSSVNLTNPKHLDFPDIGSVITRTVLIELGKFFWKNANKCASVVDADKSPTNKRIFRGLHYRS